MDVDTYYCMAIPGCILKYNLTYSIIFIDVR